MAIEFFLDSNGEFELMEFIPGDLGADRIPSIVRIAHDGKAVNLAACDDEFRSEVMAAWRSLIKSPKTSVAADKKEPSHAATPSPNMGTSVGEWGGE